MTFFTELRRAARYKRLKAVRRRRLSKITPAYSHCKNCDTKLGGVFCHKCGQSSCDTTQSFFKFVKSYFENTFQTDGKVFATLHLLLFKPGKLTLEFVNGHIIKYVHPMKLFLFCSVFLFTLMWFVFEKGIEKSNPFFGRNVDVTVSDTVNDDHRSKSATSILDNITDSIVNHGSFMINDTSDVYLTQLRQMAADIDKPRNDEVTNVVKGTLKRDLPFIFIFLMPLHALILKRFFRRSYKNYLPHFVFAMHVTTLMLILLTLIVCSATIPNTIAIFSVVSLISFVGYIIVATRVFYGQSWFKTALKSLTVLFLITISGTILSLLGIAFSLVHSLQVLKS